MNKENEYHIEVYEDNGTKYVLLEDLKVVLEAGQERQQRIDKAIEYLKENAKIDYDSTKLALDFYKELFYILRGKDNDI